jgi:dienelactone hydrolase
VIAVLLVVVVATPALALAPAAATGERAARDCADWAGDPVPGTAEWEQADLENQRCAGEGQRLIEENPAVAAANAANAEVRAEGYLGDPFRVPHRWDGERGRYELTTYTDRDGTVWSAALFGPHDVGGGPYPGVLLVCHVCGPLPTTTETLALWYWAAEALAEAGYVVLYAAVGGNSVDRAMDATEFLTATPDAPTARGEFNPWHARLDRERLGIVGHSGAAGVALTVGHADPRYDAVVAWDPARSFSFESVVPRVPTMILVADYTRDGTEARAEPPVPEPGSRFTFYDTIRAAGIDTMQVAPRASTHLDWTHFTGMPHSIYGEMVATYYTRAWLDRYVAGSSDARGGRRESRATARKALGRLTASGTDRFDRSADALSIGSGFFDPRAAQRAGDDEAGNVPITLRGIPVRNLLSFQHGSRYFLDGGEHECDDLRARCGGRRR